MRLPLLVAFLFASCQTAQTPVEPQSTSAASSEAAPPQEERISEVESPRGHATLIHITRTRDGLVLSDRVFLAARGDTTEVFSWEIGKSVGVEWLSEDLGRIWLPIGANYVHESLFVEGSTGRVSPALANDMAVDPEAGTVMTYDYDAFTLRELWTGQPLASWSPTDLDLIQLWQQCAPSGTLDGRTATLVYDCGESEQTRLAPW